MASTAAYNNKNAPVYSPTAPNLSEMSPQNIPFAVQVDVTPISPQASHVQVAHPPPRHVQIPVDAARTTHQPTSSGWEIGLFECCSTPSHCCMALFFPCINGAAAAKGIGKSGILVGLFFFAVYMGEVAFAIASGTIQESDKEYEYEYDRDRGRGYYYTYSTDGRFSMYYIGILICSLLFIAGLVILRRSVRAFYQIPGSSINDFCCSFWCSCCVMSQLSAHTERAKARRSANMSTLPAYHAA